MAAFAQWRRQNAWRIIVLQFSYFRLEIYDFYRSSISKLFEKGNVKVYSSIRGYCNVWYTSCDTYDIDTWIPHHDPKRSQLCTCIYHNHRPEITDVLRFLIAIQDYSITNYGDYLWSTGWILILAMLCQNSTFNPSPPPANLTFTPSSNENLQIWNVHQIWNA